MSCNIREISNQSEPKESTNGYREKGKTGDSNLLQYGFSQQLLFTDQSPCTKQLKTALLQKQSTFICWYWLNIKPIFTPRLSCLTPWAVLQGGQQTPPATYKHTQFSDHPHFCFFNLHDSTKQTYRNIALPINRKPWN